MREKSAEEFIDKLERQFRMRARIKSFLFDAAISAMAITNSYGAIAVYNETHKIDTLPHD